jgi:hypothetical protein
MRVVKKYNKILILIFLSAIYLCGCNKGNEPSFKIFNWYNKNDSLIKSKIFIQQLFKKDGIDSIVVTSNDTITVNFKQIEDSIGIYRFCNNEKKILTHSFFDSSITEFCRLKPPFLNRSVSYRGNRSYLINGKKYKLYHFIENTGNHITYDSYYLKGIGFICYYSFDKDGYILCDSVSGFEINSQTLNGINTQLLNDTAFFARYHLRKILPDYYRPYIMNDDKF